MHWTETVRIAALLLTIGLAACSAQSSVSNLRAAARVNDSDIVVVRLSNFQFDPEYVRLKAGATVLLRLVNESDGGHDFSSPTLFATSSFPATWTAPRNGEVEVAPHQTVDVPLVPRVPGTYPLECTHFLHGVFGMKGTIEVTP
jgi:plastocyanin